MGKGQKIFVGRWYDIKDEVNNTLYNGWHLVHEATRIIEPGLAIPEAVILLLLLEQGRPVGG